MPFDSGKEPLIKRFRKMPASQRRQVNLLPKRRVQVDEKYYDRDTLLEWAKEKGVTSYHSLQKIREKGEPNLRTFMIVFGSWNGYRKAAGLEIVESAFSRHTPEFQEPPHDLEYLVRLVIEFDLWKRKDWDQKHKEKPDIVPSSRVVDREVGPWGNLKVLAMSESFRLTMRKYLSLRRRLNRYPYRHECEKHGIDLTPWLKKFGSKRILDGMLDEMEKAEENALRRRSEEQSD